MTFIAVSYTHLNVKYHDFPSDIRPVLHIPELPIRVPLETWNLDEDEVVTNVESCADLSGDEERRDPGFLENTYNGPQLINQSEVNDLVCDLNLSKSQPEILASRLKGWNLLQQNTKIKCFL